MGLALRGGASDFMVMVMVKYGSPRMNVLSRHLVYKVIFRNLTGGNEVTTNAKYQKEFTETCFHQLKLGQANTRPIFRVGKEEEVQRVTTFLAWERGRDGGEIKRKRIQDYPIIPNQHHQQARPQSLKQITTSTPPLVPT